MKSAETVQLPKDRNGRTLHTYDEAEEQESPDDFDFDASFEITCEEVINSIRESALARLGIGCGARVVNDA